jgi:uncharacterized membrane protein
MACASDRGIVEPRRRYLPRRARVKNPALSGTRAETTVVTQDAAREPMHDDQPEGASEAARRWAAHEQEVQAARAADAETARADAVRIEAQRERGYDNRIVTWVGLAIALVLVAGGLLLVNRLVDQTRLEDCLLAHRRNCADLLDKR